MDFSLCICLCILLYFLFTTLFLAVSVDFLLYVLVLSCISLYCLNCFCPGIFVCICFYLLCFLIYPHISSHDVGKITCMFVVFFQVGICRICWYYVVFASLTNPLPVKKPWCLCFVWCCPIIFAHNSCISLHFLVFPHNSSIWKEGKSFVCVTTILIRHLCKFWNSVWFVIPFFVISFPWLPFATDSATGTITGFSKMPQKYQEKCWKNS